MSDTSTLTLTFQLVFSENPLSYKLLGERLRCMIEQHITGIFANPDENDIKTFVDVSSTSHIT